MDFLVVRKSCTTDNNISAQSEDDQPQAVWGHFVMEAEFPNCAKKYSLPTLALKLIGAFEVLIASVLGPISFASIAHLH